MKVPKFGNHRFGVLMATLLVAIPALSQGQFAAPPASNPVVDQANALEDSAETQLNDGLRRLYSDTGIQIGVLTVDTTSGIPIEQASIAVTDRWKLGKEKSDKGVLLFVAVSDRAVRIEVGQGLEGTLTDAYSKRIVDQLIIPAFRSGNLTEGIVAGVAGILRFAAPEIDPQTYLGAQSIKTIRRQPSTTSSPFRPGLLIVFLFLAFKVLAALSRISGGPALGGRSYRRNSGFGWGGGGGWGGSSGGSSWSGGGGGFSGGGASGRW